MKIRRKTTKLLLYGMAALLTTACSNDDDFTNSSTTNALTPYEVAGQLQAEPKEQMRNAILEATDLMQTIKGEYPNAYSEVLTLLKGDFYQEPYVGLFELLEPDSALIYKFVDVSETVKGKFKVAFDTEIRENPSKYPNLVEISERKRDYSFLKNSKTTNVDFDLEFYDEAAIAFYAPYIEDLNDIEFYEDDALTLVPGVIDSDSGLGYQESPSGGWNPIDVDDAYAEENLTLIIEPNHYSQCGGEYSLAAPLDSETVDTPQLYDCNAVSNPGGSNPYNGGSTGGGTSTSDSNQYTGVCSSLEPKTSGGFIRQVFIGHTKINNKKQYDKLISFTGNGGGSEIRIGRLASRELITIDSTGNISANQWNNVIQVYFSRRDIRKKRRKWVGSIWDTNWECRGTIHEQLFGVYEEDTEGDIVFDQSIRWQDEDLFSIDATIQNRSKDEIIRKWTREKTEFFATNLLDQGGGTWDGEFSFSDRGWAIYDVGTNFSYTMPHRWVDVGNNSGF